MGVAIDELSVALAPKMADSAVSTVMAILANLTRGMEMYRFGGNAELRVSEHYKFAEGLAAMLLEVSQGIAHLDDELSVRMKTAAT